MTPLFPKYNGRIYIKQGKVGDCYLLASLDCVFNTDWQGYQFIKSLFTEVPGGVVVRLRHNANSVYLESPISQSKYQYYYDEKRKQDVFFLNTDCLRDIDESSAGVQTNSLAVKILERLSSYYYAFNRPNHRRTSSLAAHDLSKRFKESSTVFVAKLLGIYAHEISDINEIIKIKNICPELPIYTSMHYRTEQRHALRMSDLMPNQQTPEEYKVALINPWNNELTEIWSLSELKKRKARFSIFVLNHSRYQLVRMFMDVRCDELGKTIFANDPFLDMLLKVKRLLGSSFDMQSISYCLLILQFNPFTPYIFNYLSLLTQQAVTKDICIAKDGAHLQVHRRLVSFFSGHTAWFEPPIQLRASYQGFFSVPAPSRKRIAPLLEVEEPQLKKHHLGRSHM